VGSRRGWPVGMEVDRVTVARSRGARGGVMRTRVSFVIGVWISLVGPAAAQGPSPLPRTQTIVEEIRRLEGVRDPKCHATASRLEDLIYGTPLTAGARFRKNDLQKELVLAIWAAASDRARRRGLDEIPRDVPHRVR